jgi:hypothetical protein
VKLLWHIVWKDARRLRWALAGWAGLIVVQLLIGAWMVARAGFDLEFAKRLAELPPILFRAQLIAAYLMVAWLVHEDLVVGIRSHWMTLPISGWRLCLAKLTALALFFWVLPCVLALPWWLTCGFGARAIAGLTIQTMVLHAAVTLPALPIAVLTDNWTRFITWTLVLVFALVTGLAVSSATADAESGLISGGIRLSRVLLMLGIWFVTIAGVTVHQFLTRRTGRSIGIAATGVVAAVAVFGGWSHDLSPRLRQVLARRDVPVWHNAIHVEAGTEESASRVELRRNVSEREAVLRLRLKVTVDDLAGREDPGFVDVEAEWRWANGVSLKRHTTLGEQFSGFDVRNAALTDPRSAVRTRREFDWGGSVGNIPPSLAAKMLAAPPILRGKVAMRVYRREITGEFPLVVGARFAEGAQTIRIVRCDPTRYGALDVTAMVTQPQLLVDDVRRWLPLPASSVVYLDLDALGRSALVAANLATRDPMDSMYLLGGAVHSQTTISIVVAGVEISRRLLTVWCPRLRKPEFRGVSFRDLREKYGLQHAMDAYEAPDPHWFDGATLVSLATTPVGRLETTFTIERFEVKEGQRRVAP